MISNLSEKFMYIFKPFYTGAFGAMSFGMYNTYINEEQRKLDNENRDLKEKINNEKMKKQYEKQIEELYEKIYELNQKKWFWQ